MTSAPSQREGYARPELLADTAWLQQCLEDPKLRIIDCDPYDTYRRAHIKGAVGLRVNHYIKDAKDSVHVMPPDQFAQLMGSLGVDRDTTVVTYDGAGSLYAARVWWTLNYYGHTNVKVLDGGWNKWFLEDRPGSIEAPKLRETSYQPRANPDLLCTLDHGKACVGKPDSLFLDVRSDGEWTGENNRGNKRVGHIPGAVHLEWTNFVTKDEPRVFKPAGELRAMLAQAGVTPEREVITY
jgi:thiosulfate/3-mercaptopyruvate sulfurtransferase